MQAEKERGRGDCNPTKRMLWLNIEEKAVGKRSAFMVKQLLCHKPCQSEYWPVNQEWIESTLGVWYSMDKQHAVGIEETQIQINSIV